VREHGLHRAPVGKPARDAKNSYLAEIVLQSPSRIMGIVVDREHMRQQPSVAPERASFITASVFIAANSLAKIGPRWSQFVTYRTNPA